jgi:hypothetical protein
MDRPTPAMASMQIEQLEILDFLRAHRPFDELPEEALQRTAVTIDVRYYKAGERIVEFGEVAEYWHLVRSGAVEVFRRNGTLYNRLTEGGYFGEFGLLRSGRVRFPVVALEDALLYLIPARGVRRAVRPARGLRRLRRGRGQDPPAPGDVAQGGRQRPAVGHGRDAGGARGGDARQHGDRARGGAAHERGGRLLAADRG